MPELPEVEVVRAGLARWVTGRQVAQVDVHHPRAVRRHVAGAGEFAAALTGSWLACASRRGKYLWFPLDDSGPSGQADRALVAHLGMSGQLLMVPTEAPGERHLRVRVRFADDGRDLRFVDQRTFGGLAITPLVADSSGGRVPDTVAHIARDPLDPLFDEKAFIRTVRSKHSDIKRILLDQTVVSGIGNIYADESLWRARIHGRRAGDALPAVRVGELLAHAQAVMLEALEQGGTSFDSLYVNVNGESGYFDRSLHAYGRVGEPCDRCGAPIRREAFMNRSSYFCPVCQRAPRGLTPVRG